MSFIRTAELAFGDSPKLYSSPGVYLANWQAEKVAVKIIKQSREANVVEEELTTIRSKLDHHPRVLQILALCNDLPAELGKLGIIMEYALNGNLQSFLESEQASVLLPSRLLRLVLDISEALSFGHSHDISHGNLKSSNVWVTEDLRAKVAEFGLERAWAEGAPINAKPSDDVYSFGIILQEILDSRSELLVLAGSVEIHALLARCLSEKDSERPAFADISTRIRSLLAAQTKVEEDEHNAPPFSFLCPITQELMRDPVMTSDGHSYERIAIEIWLQRNDTSPLTNIALLSRTLVPNLTLKAAIEEWKQLESTEPSGDALTVMVESRQKDLRSEVIPELMQKQRPLEANKAKLEIFQAQKEQKKNAKKTKARAAQAKADAELALRAKQREEDELLNGQALAKANRVIPAGLELCVYNAAERGDAVALRALAEEWGDVPGVINWSNPSSCVWTPLIMACCNGKLECVRLLASLPAIEVNKADANGCTALYAACINGHVDCARVVASSAGCDVNAADKDGWSSLHVVCRNGYVNCVRMLVSQPFIDVNKADSKNCSPLLIACCYGRTDCVRFLASLPRIDIDKASSEGVSPMTVKSSEEIKNILRRARSK